MAHFSESPKRMLSLLPGFYKVTSRPTVDPMFFHPVAGTMFRSYLWDSLNRTILEEQGRSLELLREADEFVSMDAAVEPAIYGGAIRVDPANGTVFDHGVNLEDDTQGSWSLTFVQKARWNTQPSASSVFYPFRTLSGGASRFGYIEHTGQVLAGGWVDQTTGAAVTGLDHDVGWLPKQLLVATLTTDAAAKRTNLWVNGVLVATVAQAIKQDVDSNLHAARTTTAAETGKTDLEAYYIHDKVLEDAQIEYMHSIFRTGMSSDSRIVRTFTALGMVLAEVEERGLNLWKANKVDFATGGELVRLGMDYGVLPRAGEDEEEFRQRIKNKLLEMFSQGTINDIVAVAAARGKVDLDAVVYENETNANGDYAPAHFRVLLPPEASDRLVAVQESVDAAKIAGVKAAVGTKGTFAWDVAGSGFGVGAWTFAR